MGTRIRPASLRRCGKG